MTSALAIDPTTAQGLRGLDVSDGEDGAIQLVYARQRDGEFNSETKIVRIWELGQPIDASNDGLTVLLPRPGHLKAAGSPWPILQIVRKSNVAAHSVHVLWAVPPVPGPTLPHRARALSEKGLALEVRAGFGFEPPETKEESVQDGSPSTESTARPRHNFWHLQLSTGLLGGDTSHWPWGDPGCDLHSLMTIPVPAHDFKDLLCVALISIYDQYEAADFARAVGLSAGRVPQVLAFQRPPKTC